MVRGLQVTISGTELGERLADRIRIHQSKATALEERISRRTGDLPFDIRAGDGLETFGELQSAHELHRDRAAQLAVLRDGLSGDETYVLTMADLQAADLAQRASSEGGNRRDADVVEQCSSAPVDGLRVTISGARLEKMLEEDFENRVLSFDPAAGHAAGRIAAERRRAGRPVEIRDLQIAGIAKVRKATLATRNIRHFEGCGVVLVDPWSV